MIELYKGMPNTHLKGGDKMATIRKRGNTYQIRVSCGYDVNGDQVIQTMTWKPDEGMSKKQIEKELNRQAVMFEEDVIGGQVTMTKKFQTFAEEWFKEYAEIKLKTQTLRNYHNLEKRTYDAIGHLRMDKITPRTIQKFVSDLCRTKKYNSKGEETGTLSPKTVKHYVYFVSSVFDYAVRMQLVKDNPCRKVKCSPFLKRRARLTTNIRSSLHLPHSPASDEASSSGWNGKILTGKRS